jgi:hypothetical protein
MKHLSLISSLLCAARLAASGAEPQSAAQTPAAGESNSFSGKVAETMDAASYTYVLLDTGSNKVWAAAPQFTVKVGDSVAIARGMAMPGYHSKTLNRDFDVVYFTGTVEVNGAAKIEAGAPAGLPKNHPPIGGAAGGNSAPPARPDFTGLKKAQGGKTIQELYAAREKLAGKPVVVRGKVVKYNSMIMGKNWLHLQDGTGSAGGNDLVVTSMDEARVGDTVLVTGTAATDKDFGAGYKFGLIVEDAKIVVE